MTRTEFNATFAATKNNTEGFTQAQLDRLNGLVFERVSDMEADARNGAVKSTVDHWFSALSASYHVAEA